MLFTDSTGLHPVDVNIVWIMKFKRRNIHIIFIHFVLQNQWYLQYIHFMLLLTVLIVLQVHTKQQIMRSSFVNLSLRHCWYSWDTWWYQRAAAAAALQMQPLLTAFIVIRIIFISDFLFSTLVATSVTGLLFFAVTDLRLGTWSCNFWQLHCKLLWSYSRKLRTT